MKIDRLLRGVEIDLFVSDMKEVAKTSKTGFVHVLVETPKRHRTTGPGSQGHHLNGHIQQICQQTGNDFDDVKRFVKQMAIPMGYPMQMRRGIPVYDLWGNPVGISEAECDTTQCGYLIDCVHRLASELGIILKENESETWYF